MNLNLSRSINTVRNIVVSNSPELLVGTAIVGVITTGILAARAGYKARGIIDDERMRQIASPEPPFDNFLDYKNEFYEKTTPLSVGEKVKLTWLCYAVPAVTGATTIASVVGVHTIHTKRHAALAGLYAVTANRLDDVQSKAEEMLGAKKAQQLKNATGQALVDKDPIVDNEVIVLPGGTELMYEEYSGRYFLGSVPMVEKAVGEINLQLKETGDASLNDYFDQLGLGKVPLGTEFGWSGARIDPSFGAVKTSDGRSAVSVYFHDTPRPTVTK